MCIEVKVGQSLQKVMCLSSQTQFINRSGNGQGFNLTLLRIITSTVWLVIFARDLFSCFSQVKNHSRKLKPQKDTIWLVIFVDTNFAKQAKVRVSEIFNVLIFTVGEPGTRGLTLSELMSRIFSKRDGDFSSLFQCGKCGKESSLIPRTFVVMIASTVGLAPLSGLLSVLLSI